MYSNGINYFFPKALNRRIAENGNANIMALLLLLLFTWKESMNVTGKRAQPQTSLRKEKKTKTILINATCSPSLPPGEVVNFLNGSQSALNEFSCFYCCFDFFFLFHLPPRCCFPWVFPSSVPRTSSHIKGFSGALCGSYSLY